MQNSIGLKKILVIHLIFFMLDATTIHAQGQLSNPIFIGAGQNLLDVELHGQASPWICDIDGDGKKDLLVGEGYDGRLRIYHNVEANGMEGYSLLNEENGSGNVPRNNGFCPQVVDLDKDGLDDILTPAWYGLVYWFRQIKKGEFGVGQPIVGIDGNAIVMEWTHGVTAVDWNNDGKLDLVVGLSHRDTQAGLVLLENISQPTSVQFSKPVAIMAGEKNLDVPAESPAPTAADWDGDGLFDLLIGSSDGSVRFFRNQGTQGAPTFSNFELLVTQEMVASNSKICVADWDLDGKLDLIVGDHGPQFDKQVGPKEEAVKLEAKKSHEDAMARWGSVYRLYSQMRKSKSAPSTIERLQLQLKKENQKQKLAYAKYREFSEVRQYHGNVRVFFRK